MLLALTLIIEGVGVYLAARWLRYDRLVLLRFSLLLNLITQPLFAFWLRFILTGMDHQWWHYFLIGEIVVWLVEAAAYGWRLGNFSKGLRLSGIANLTSAGIGVFLPF